MKESTLDSDFFLKTTFIPTEITGINESPFVDFTTSCNFDFEKMDEEICMGLATTNLDKLPMVGGVIPPKLREREIDGEFELSILANYSGNKSVFSKMSPMEIRKYLFFKHKNVVPWYFILDLKPNVFKTKTQDLYPWADIIEKFQYTKQCIEELPFTEIGRVVIYGSWPEARVPCHKDRLMIGNFDHHINFNPGGYRPIYVYDSLNDKKVFLPKDYKLYAYNTSDYHGVDPLPHFSYTIRVDGVYNEIGLNLITKG
jgi:hypothetical protein